MKYWQVYNARGRMYLAEGNTAQEAIDNARPLFASNHIRRPWGVEPNPEFAQLGMTAVALTVDPPTIRLCFCPSMDDQRDPEQHESGCLAATVLRIDRARAAAGPVVWRPLQQVPGRSWSPPQVPAGCYEVSFGWVHVKPSCRCGKAT